MSVNSSSFADLSPPPPHLSSSNSSLHPLMDTCVRSNISIFVLLTFLLTNLLLLPIFVLVIYLGYQQWRKQRSVSTPAASHSDILTYHSLAMQLNEVLGNVVFICSIYINDPEMTVVGNCFCSFSSFGQALFHLLTCVERYLAVVHPITYLRLRQTGGVRVRNVSVGCVWLLSFVYTSVNVLSSSEFNRFLFISVMASFLVVTSFCSISVLCALKRPGPGEAGGNGQRVDQSKQRAFHTITIIMGILYFRFGGNMAVSVMQTSLVLRNLCEILIFVMWMNLPSCLVLPLLFLHRAGKLRCGAGSAESG